MPYGKKHKPKKDPSPEWRKPTSPSRRKEPWIPIMLRAHVYAMVRELALHHDVSMGEVVRVIVEAEFQKTVWKLQQEEIKARREESGAAPKDRA